jgi:hypothetical protein
MLSFSIRVQRMIRLRRYSDIRKELLAMAKQAASAAKILNTLSASLR